MGRSEFLRPRHWDWLTIAAFGLLTFCFLFGGASRENELRLALVELAALPLFLLLASDRAAVSRWKDHRFALFLLGLLVALPLIQLVPVPSGFALALPGRDDLATALDLAGLEPAWLPLSLTPDETWQAFLFLLPPAAVFLAVVLAGGDLGRRLILGVLAGCMAFVLLGAVQLASGGDRLYPWTTTDAGQMVGLFANRNHLATLCLVTLPFVAVWVARHERIGGRNVRWLGGVYLFVMLVALAAIRSRAGVVLVIPALVISMIAIWSALGRGARKPVLIGLAMAAGAVILGIGLFASSPILQRFESHATAEGRFENWPYVIQAAQDYLPLGGGIGSFDPIYRSVEPLAHVDPTYFNHAHNEYLEIWLETGWLGVALLIAFFVWWGRRSLKVWRGGASTARDLQRAASGAILLILLHSAADYPLRTEIIAVIFALCCGLLETASRTDAHDDAPDSPIKSSGRRRRRRT